MLDRVARWWVSEEPSGRKSWMRSFCVTIGIFLFFDFKEHHRLGDLAALIALCAAMATAPPLLDWALAGFTRFQSRRRK